MSPGEIRVLDPFVTATSVTPLTIVATHASNQAQIKKSPDLSMYSPSASLERLLLVFFLNVRLGNLLSRVELENCNQEVNHHLLGLKAVYPNVSPLTIAFLNR